MAKCSFLLLTTYDAQGGRQQEVERLMQSLRRARELEGLNIVHLVLGQRVAHESDCLHPDVGQLVTIPGRLSLSAARNRLLELARREGWLDKVDVVGFPDDDAWYPDGFLSHVAQALGADTGHAVFFCQYGSQPVSVQEPAGRGLSVAAVNTHELVKNISSNTMFFLASVARQVPGFDEDIGLGAPFNGGEDLDYALRCFVVGHQSGLRAVYTPAKMVGHRDKFDYVAPRYFPGSLRALRKSAAHHPGILAQMLRKILVGVYFVARRKLTPKEFFTGFMFGLFGAGGARGDA